MKKITQFSGFILTSILLTACGGGDGANSQSSHKPNDENLLESSEGRLLVINDDTSRSELSLYDLTQSKTVDRVALSNVPTGVYASPGFRYGVLLDRNNHTVHFYDGGLTPKGDKILSVKPQLLNYQLFGASPTHYRNFNGQAAIFYDGSDTETSKFDVFTDAGISSKNVASQKLPFKHHGVAEPLGEYVLSSYSGSGETLASVVRNFELHGDHFHGQNNLQNTCPGLHGASSVKDYSAFGCEDGVLLVEHGVAGNFKDSKLPLDVRIGTVVGQENTDKLIGLASTTPDLFIIDPVQKSIHRTQWVNDLNTTRLKQTYSTSGQYFVILDSTGVLNIFDTKDWEIKTRLPVIDAQSPDLTKTQLVVNGRSDDVYLNDIQKKAIVQVDLKTGTIKKVISLDIVPNQFTWLGVSGI